MRFHRLIEMTLTLADHWKISVWSKISRTEDVHYYTVENHNIGVRVHADGYFVDVDVATRRIRLWRSYVKYGDYVDEVVAEIDLNDYLRRK